MLQEYWESKRKQYRCIKITKKMESPDDKTLQSAIGMKVIAV